MSHNILTIAKREIRGFFSSPVAFVIIVIFLLLLGFFTFMIADFFGAGEANLLTFFTWHPWLYLVFVPAVGMGMWAEERRLGTIELLLTMPITPWEAIIGKFLASWAIVGVSLVLTFPVVITVNYLGSPDNGVILAGYIGSFLMAGTYLAISAMTSAMTRSQVVSFILSLVILLFLILCGFPPVTNMLVNWAYPWVVQGVAGISVLTHFQSIEKGVLDTRDLVYFISVMIFALFATGVIIRAHRAG